ncbi:MAG: hypothetical protein G01um101419_102 [Parcubacteria group bacterium Gr01-1014_19]|nr:MAG: hypothetical protein G01um101419_102 [Parcubacteria group bacterium Gr01-1014_19]
MKNMKQFKMEVAPTDGIGEFGSSGRVIRVEAETLEGAMKKARAQMKESEDFHQIFVVESGSRDRCVYDFFNGARIYQPV